MRGHGLAAWVVAVLAFAPNAFAQQPQQKAGEDLAVAESLFRAGKAAMAQKRYDEACPKFAESNRLDPQMGTLLNLAYCHEASAKTASAWGEFNEVAAQAARAGQTSRVTFAKEHAAALEAKLSRVKLNAEGANVNGSTVKVDGSVVGAAAIGTAIPMDPGAHRIEVSAPGKKTLESKFDVPQGPSVTEVPVPLLTDPSLPLRARAAVGEGGEQTDATSPDSSHGASGQRTLGFVLGGVGVAGLAAGAVFGVVYLGKASDYNKCSGFCGAGPQDDQSQKSSAQTAGWIATAGLGVGAALLVTGTVLVLTSKPSSPVESRLRQSRRPPVESRLGQSRRPPERTSRVELVPMLSPKHGGLSVEGRF